MSPMSGDERHRAEEKERERDAGGCRPCATRPPSAAVQVPPGLASRKAGSASSRRDSSIASSVDVRLSDRVDAGADSSRRSSRVRGSGSPPGRPPISGYIGFDASARSLHVGNLVQVFMLTHLQRAGGTPFVVIGGGTGMIGDPIGQVAGAQPARRRADRCQLGGASARSWSVSSTSRRARPRRRWSTTATGSTRYSMLDFLRDIGKHFSVPYMLAKDSVQRRLAAGTVVHRVLAT